MNSLFGGSAEGARSPVATATNELPPHVVASKEALVSGLVEQLSTSQCVSGKTFKAELSRQFRQKMHSGGGFTLSSSELLDEVIAERSVFVDACKLPNPHLQI